MDNPFTKTFPVSWHELHRDCKALAWKLVTAGPWKGIIAITRGGLVPAAIVARELDVRLIDTVSIAIRYCPVSCYDVALNGCASLVKKLVSSSEP